MSNQPATFLAFREEFTKTTIDAQELNSAIAAMEAELYKMKDDKALLNRELSFLRTKLPEIIAEEIINGSVEELLTKIIEVTFTMFSTIITVILTAGATSRQLDFLQAVKIAGNIFILSIFILGALIAIKKVAFTFLKPVTMIFDNSFRQPLIYTVSYMLTHQNEMKNIKEDELLALLQKNIATQKE